MKTYILLLRGINVGGKNTVSMKALKKIVGEQWVLSGGHLYQQWQCVFL